MTKVEVTVTGINGYMDKTNSQRVRIEGLDVNGVAYVANCSHKQFVHDNPAFAEFQTLAQFRANMNELINGTAIMNFKDKGEILVDGLPCTEGFKLVESVLVFKPENVQLMDKIADKIAEKYVAKMNGGNNLQAKSAKVKEAEVEIEVEDLEGPSN